MKKTMIYFHTILLTLTITSNAISAELNIWHTESDPRTIAALDKIATRFESMNSEAKINMVSIGWNDLYRKVTLSIKSGNAPDLTQIQPFMAAYLYHMKLLQPIDDVVNSLDKKDIFSAVLDLQLFDGKRYGIATALGISYFSYRKDLMPPNISADKIKNWSDYLEILRQLKKNRPRIAPVLLPANDLHITLLFTELLAANGGSLFSDTGQPDFSNKTVIQTLNFWKDLYNLIPKKLRNSSYKENFAHYAQGRAITLPSFFGRGTLAIERIAPEEYRSPNHFALFHHPVGTSGSIATATLDAEPWVILKGSPNPNLAKKFLRFFYQKKNYIEFCKSVPIHLTPIFRSLANSNEYTELPHVKKWKPYSEYTTQMLEKGAILPIFMASNNDRFRPALFKLEGSRVISGMVRDVTLNDLTPAQAAKKAMTKAADLMKGLPALNLNK